MSNPSPLSLVSQIIAYENSELDEDEVIDLFRDLIRSGTIYHLQGHYGRTAQSFIDAGLIGEVPCTAS